MEAFSDQTFTQKLLFPTVRHLVDTHAAHPQFVPLPHPLGARDELDVFKVAL